jgi:hypothetical protein
VIIQRPEGTLSTTVTLKCDDHHNQRGGTGMAQWIPRPGYARTTLAFFLGADYPGYSIDRKLARSFSTAAATSLARMHKGSGQRWFVIPQHGC